MNGNHNSLREPPLLGESPHSICLNLATDGQQWPTAPHHKHGEKESAQCGPFLAYIKFQDEKKSMNKFVWLQSFFGRLRLFNF
jgi:hypothetical protein